MRIKECFWWVFAIVGVCFLSIRCSNVEQDYCCYVNPFIGNADNGHTFPGACVPFGMIQVSPESGNGSWRYCSGFNIEDDSVMGFSQNHLNGTGCPDLGDILILPFCGNIQNGKYKSRYDKEHQKAYPGYYSVVLSDFEVDVELTATQRTAMHRYTFRKEGPAHILVDLQSGIVSKDEQLRTHVIDAEMQLLDQHSIAGKNRVKMWVEREFFYVIKFDKPYMAVKELQPQKGEKAKRLLLSFDLKQGESVQVKVGLSTVSIEGAQEALEKENPDWNFEKVKTQATEAWNNLLSRIDVSGTEEQKVNFYTSIYHLCIQPNNITDVDGRYRGANDSILHSPIGEYYSTLSLWDTYRAAHPLYTFLVPEKVNGFVNSMLSHCDIQGYLPIWALWGKENHCMIGNHAIPVIVEAYLKGYKGFDPERAYEAIRKSSLESHPKSDWETYNQYGYYPFDLVPEESVSRTLESCYDDYCVAQMAKALGKKEDYDFFSQRARAYTSLFDPATKLMRGKDSQGKWRDPFDPFRLSHAGTSGGDYTEGNAWQYVWHVQHDVDSLIEMMGGNKAFTAKLDSLFRLEDKTVNTGFVSDVTGLIGQYAHGNEPSHHVAYLYNYAGEPWKTQELIREIFDRFYLPVPNGLCGNDDCGQMSAWYLFSAMGFYPVDPISGEYIIGAPQLKEIVLRLEGEKNFTIRAENLSKENKYVKAVFLNGKELKRFRIFHHEITDGGLLEFIMTDNPSETFK